MARKRTIRTTEYDAPDDEGREVILPADPAEESYSAFMSKWGHEGAKVRVYRVTPQGKQYCFLGTPEEIDPESLRLFHAKQSYAHETGSYLIEIEVNGEVRSPFPIMIAPQVNAPGIPHGPGGNNDGPLAEMFKLLQAQNERLERQASQAREPLGNIADALVKLDQLRGNQKSELPIDTLMKAIQLGKEMGGNGGGNSDSWLSLIREALPVLAPVLGSLTRAAPQQPQRPGETPTTEAVDVNSDELLLKGAIGYLKKKALAGSDPGLYVDIVLDNQDEPVYQQLVHRILESDFSAFAAIDPEISKPEYAAFFRTIYDGLRSVFIPTDSVVPDTGGTPGNTSNPPGDGKPRKKSSTK